MAIALVALVGSTLVLGSLLRLEAAIASRHRSDEIIADLDAFRTAMLNQETGVRGYLLTDQPGSLEPYALGRPALDAAIGRLRALVGSDTAENAALDQAEQAARDWQNKVGDPIVRDMANPSTRDAARAIERSGVGKLRFDDFRA